MLIETRQIVLKRPHSPALIFPDLLIDHGESVLLLGPSGSGKTTLLSILAGLLPPAAGTVLINGIDFYGLASHERDSRRGQSFGFIFQTLHLLPSLTIRQNILLAAKMAGLPADDAKAISLLDSLGLADKEGRKPHQLSQGEQQRVAIARAVYNKPSILIADEPTSALDDVNTTRTIELITEQAKKNGSALIIATHDNRIKNRFEKIIDLQDQLTEAA